jgi:colanic acid/amylovoran biosynthesis glycosyltransferase
VVGSRSATATNSGVSDQIRVLHSLGVFLRTTENWIYPQITLVPGVTSAVLCHQILNPVAFPLEGQPLWKREIFARNPAQPRVFRAVKRMMNLPANAAALSHARIWKPTIVHAHFGTVGWQSLRLKRVLAAPLVTTFYGYDGWQLPTTNPEWEPRFARLFTRGDFFLVEGPAFRQRLVDLGCPLEKIRIRRLGVDLGRLTYQSRKFTGTLKIAMVGRFVEKKGLVDGLTACAKATASGVNLSVTIIGDTLPGDPVGQGIKQELAAIIESFRMTNHVNFKGTMSHEETVQLLAAHDILLCPSKHSTNGDAEGGLPFVLTEAMALGLLCVGSNHCDIPEAIIHGITGFLFDEGNVDQLSAWLQRISCDPECAPSITAAARKHVEENFDQSRQLLVLAQIYQEIVRRGADANGSGVCHR